VHTIELATPRPASVVTTDGNVRIQGHNYTVGVDPERISRAVGLVNRYGLVHPQDPELTGITITFGETAGFHLNNAGDPSAPLYSPNGRSHNLQIQVPDRISHKGAEPEQALSVEQERLNRIVKAGVGIAASESRIRRKHAFQSRVIAVAGSVLAITTGVFMAKEGSNEKAAITAGALFAGSAGLAGVARLPQRSRRSTDNWARQHMDQPNLGLGPSSEPDIFELPLIYYRRSQT